jgi:LysR family transcriptional regulator, low CO2-responsive transcriptional regulator
MPDTEKPQGPYPQSAITIAGLRIFESVARHASFSRAAEELRVSQPYVSNQIHELEAKLRVTLFRRVGRRVYLTEPGILLNRHANELLQRIAVTERETADLREVIVGRLDLASVVIAAEHVLPLALGKFRAQYPEVTLSLQVQNSRQVEEAVIDRRFELGITLSHSVPPNLKSEKFGVDELVLVVGKRHPLASQTAVEPAALSAEIFLVREPSSGTRLFVESKFSEIGIRLTYGLELNNNQVIKALVEANLGIAILSSRTVEAEVLANRLSSLKIKGLALERPLTLVSGKSHTLSRPAAAFRSVLLTAIFNGNRSSVSNEPQ